MKTLKLLSILFISTLVVSCSKDDDDRDTSVDPIIGTWRADSNEDNSYSIFTFNSNGNYSLSYTDPDYPEENFEVNGTWSNSGTDFSSTRHTYRFTGLYGGGESATITLSAQFSEDFNSVTLSDEYGGEEIYIRQ